MTKGAGRNQEGVTTLREYGPVVPERTDRDAAGKGDLIRLMTTFQLDC